MQLEFKHVTSNEQKEMKDVLAVQNASHEYEFKRGGLEEFGQLVGWVFYPGRFFVVGYLDGKPVSVRECELSKPGERKQVTLYAIDVHPDYRNRRIPLRMTRYITSWAIRHGYPRVLVANASYRMRKLYKHISQTPRMMTVNGKRKKAESMTFNDEKILFRIRPRNSQRKNRNR